MRERARRSRRSRSRRWRRRSSPARTAAWPSRPSRRSGTSAPTPASARGASRSRTARTAGSTAARGRRTGATVFCALASSDMPPIEVSSSAWNSPWPASRAASERHASSTAQAPPAIRTRFSTSARSSTRSAPATIDFCAFHCQIVRPSAAPSATRLSAGTACARIQREPSRPTSSTTHRAAQQRDQRREPGEVDVRAVQVGGGEASRAARGAHRCASHAARRRSRRRATVAGSADRTRGRAARRRAARARRWRPRPRS